MDWESRGEEAKSHAVNNGIVEFSSFCAVARIHGQPGLIGHLEWQLRGPLGHSEHTRHSFNQLLKRIFLFALRTSFDKCTRKLVVLPTTENYLKVKDAQISSRRLPKQLHRA